MELYGSHFKYAGINSRRYGLIFANVDTSRFTSVAGDAKTISVYNKRNIKRYWVGDDFSSSPVSFQTEIVSEYPLSKEVQREVERWLFFKPRYTPLYFDVDDDCRGEAWDLIDGRVKRYYLNCRFINPDKLEYNGGIVGYKVTVECDSAVAWQDAVTKSFTINGSSGTSKDIVINVSTDFPDYVYPLVKFKGGTAGGDVSIVNMTDDPDRATKFTAIQQIAEVTMDGQTNYLTPSYFPKFSEKNFVRFVDGKNTLRVTGDIQTISFEWHNRRYL